MGGVNRRGTRGPREGPPGRLGLRTPTPGSSTALHQCSPERRRRAQHPGDTTGSPRGPRLGGLEGGVSPLATESPPTAAATEARPNAECSASALVCVAQGEGAPSLGSARTLQNEWPWGHVLELATCSGLPSLPGVRAELQPHVTLQHFPLPLRALAPALPTPRPTCLSPMSLSSSCKTRLGRRLAWELSPTRGLSGQRRPRAPSSHGSITCPAVLGGRRPGPRRLSQGTTSTSGEGASSLPKHPLHGGRTEEK